MARATPKCEDGTDSCRRPPTHVVFLNDSEYWLMCQLHAEDAIDLDTETETQYAALGPWQTGAEFERQNRDVPAR